MKNRLSLNVAQKIICFILIGILNLPLFASHLLTASYDMSDPSQPPGTNNSVLINQNSTLDGAENRFSNMYYNFISQSDTQQAETIGSFFTGAFFVLSPLAKGGQLGELSTGLNVTRAVESSGEKLIPITDPRRLLTAGEGKYQWGDVIQSGPAAEPIPAYRWFTPGKTYPAGQWLTPLSDPAYISRLSIPGQPTGLAYTVIPRGTQIQVGTAAPEFGKPGRGIQILILNEADWKRMLFEVIQK